MPDTFQKMDRMYRLQRHFYDVTRRYYLLGRDQLLEEMPVRNGETVLEIGCGTARNLIILSRRYPDAHFYGLDASRAMLETARSNIASAGLENITLETALADDFTFDRTFGQHKPFDTIFFSYSISMIPTWRESIGNALANLKDGGMLYIVDFSDQAELPSMFRRFLKWWLAKFHVHPRPEVITFLQGSMTDEQADVRVRTIFRRYAFLARVEKLN